MEWVQCGGLYLLLLLLPFSIAAVEVLFVCLLLCWIVQRLDPSTRAQTLWLRPSFRRTAWAIGLFLGACVLSIPGSRDLHSSLNGLIGKWLEYVMFMVLLADLAHRPRVVQRSVAVVAISAVLVLVEAVTQELRGRGVFRGYPLLDYSRMTGPYHSPADLATYLMMAGFLLLAFGAIRRGWRRWLVWGTLLAVVACLGRTIATGVWIAFGIGLIVVLVTREPRLRHPAWCLALLLLLSATAFLWRMHLARQVLTGSDVGTADRIAMWQSALKMIKDRPLLGHGVNTFMANYLDYWVGGERQPRYAHNCYLQMAAETGLIGLAAFLWLLWLLFARIRAVLRPPLSDEGVLLLGLSAGLLAFALHSAVDTNFYSLRQAALFWIFSGLALGLSERVRHQLATDAS